MKVNKLLFVAGAVTALGVAYALCKKHKLKLVASELEDTMVKGCCSKSVSEAMDEVHEEATAYDFEETAEIDAFEAQNDE